MGTNVWFTEEMKGYFTLGAPAYDVGYLTGREDWTDLMFHLTIRTDRYDVFRADPDHEMAADGWVASPALGPGRLEVVKGVFNLFAPGSTAARRTMRYRLQFHGADERPYTLVGFKNVANDPGTDLWVDTTTLFIRLFDGLVDDGEDELPEVARGILRLDAPMFARQLSTFRGDPLTVARFASLFAGTLVDIYARRPQRGARR